MFQLVEPGEIRLLHIQTGSGEQIVCNLEVVALASSVSKYDALSYTWGCSGLTHEVLALDKPFSITANLYSALQRLRSEDGDQRTVWIDAICINQEDSDERNHQVNMMADIYRNARQVVMWLGEETFFDGVSVEGIAFALLEQLRRVFETHGQIELDFQQIGFDGLSCAGYGLPNTDSRRWIALARLFCKPYFERIWIIQEVVMATKAVLKCGNLSIEWKVVRDFARSIRKCGSLGNFEYDGAAPGIISTNTMADLKDGTGIELLPLLIATRMYQATKEVDKAFALMNLVSNSKQVGVEVDYSMENTPQKLWERLAVHGLTVHQDLLILSSAGLRSAHQSSWIPNWSNGDDVHACLALHGKNHFRASGDTKVSISVSADHQILTISGYIVDTISMVAPNVAKFVPRSMKVGPLGDWQTEEEANERATSLLGPTVVYPLEIAKSAFKYTEGSIRDKEIARTLCCDTLMTGERADAENAYKVHQWFIKMTGQYPADMPLPESPADIKALQLEIEATKPSGIKMEQFMHSATAFGTNRSVCATVNGDLGRVPFGTEPGDLVCVLKGGIVPYLLRKKGDCYQLVGECFVNGIMYGECFERRDLVEREFRIV